MLSYRKISYQYVTFNRNSSLKVNIQEEFLSFSEEKLLTIEEFLSIKEEKLLLSAEFLSLLEDYLSIRVFKALE